MAQQVTDPTSIQEVVGLIPGLLAQWVKDPVLLWLWCRPAAAAPIQPLPGLGTSLCHGGGPKNQKKKKKKRKKERKKYILFILLK